MALFARGIAMRSPMNQNRRQFLEHLGAVTPWAIGGSFAAGMGLSLPAIVTAKDYRAVVVVFAHGGWDGNDMLVPTDAGYQDYYRARPNIALKRDQLVSLSRGYANGSVGMHPALEPLRAIYDRGHLAWVANIGAMIKPLTAKQWRDNEVAVPPFLMSHKEQVDFVQGWDPASILNGWGGRGMELLPSALQGSLPVISFARDNTLVTGIRSRMTLADSGGSRWWGRADLGDPSNRWTQITESMGQLQSKNRVENEFSRSLSASFNDTVRLTLADQKAPAARTMFPDANRLGRDLSYISRLMPVFQSEGIQRQFFYTDWGGFDTHVTQRGDADGRAMDIQLQWLASALVAWDTELKLTGMHDKVITLVLTEFGRTLEPAGEGTDHAWGNHWFLMGGPVKGGQVYGKLPQLVLGGVDDFDRRGRFVPDFSSDQLAGSLLNWLGLPASQLPLVFPNLANFASKTLPVLA